MGDPTAIVGPGHLPCETKCEVPAGYTMRGLPVPRHAWPGVLVCPNDCGRAWTVEETDASSGEQR